MYAFSPERTIKRRLNRSESRQMQKLLTYSRKFFVSGSADPTSELATTRRQPEPATPPTATTSASPSTSPSPSTVGFLVLWAPGLPRLRHLRPRPVEVLPMPPEKHPPTLCFSQTRFLVRGARAYWYIRRYPKARIIFACEGNFGNVEVPYRVPLASKPESAPVKRLLSRAIRGEQGD